MGKTVKHFLKCNNCQYLTEIVSENQSFCINCTQKFPNYYKGWKPESGEKNLDRYKNEICQGISVEEINKEVLKHNKKVEIKDLSGEQKIRRQHIKEGIPLDRGGHFEFSTPFFKNSIALKIFIAGIILEIIFLILNL